MKSSLRKDNAERELGEVGITSYKTKPDYNLIDPFLAWHDFAKPSRSRQQKKSWTKGARR